MTRARRVLGAATLGAALAVTLVLAPPATADLGDPLTGGSNNGDNATGTAGTTIPGRPGTGGSGGTGSGGAGGPNCTKSDGTRQAAFTTLEQVVRETSV